MQDSDRPLPMPVCVEKLRRSSRSDLIAIASAFVAFPISFWLCNGPLGAVSRDLVANMTLLAVCPAAVLVAASRAAWHEIPEELTLPSATRYGFRMGILVFFAAGGAFLLGELANSSMKRANFSPALPGVPINGTVGVLLSMFPTVAVGALTAIAKAGQGAPDAHESLLGEDKTTSPSSRKLTTAVALCLFVLGLISPTIRPLIHGERRPSAAALPGPSEAAFRYEVPAGFRESHAERVTIAASNRLPNLTTESPAAFSPDSNYLAFSDSVTGSPVIFDLRQNRVAHAFASLVGTRGLTWSPKGNLLFILGEGGNSAVLDPSKGTVTSLPVQVPSEGAQPHWNWETEIAFRHGTLMLGKLDLDTLRFERSGASVEGRPAENPAASSLNEVDRWRLEVRPVVHQLGVPDEVQAGQWIFNDSAGLFAVDKSDGRAFRLMGLEGEPVLLVSPDCSMVTAVTPSGSVTHYLGLRTDARPTHLSSAYPPLPAVEAGSELASLCNAGQLSVFVCAPFVNPLNGKVVGPDPRSVRGLAVIPYRAASKDELVVVESYYPIQPGDVAGYLHYWRNGQPFLLESKALRSWASGVTPLDGNEIPSFARSQRWQGAHLAKANAGVEFAGWLSPENPAASQIAKVAALNAAPRTEERKVATGVPKSADAAASPPETFPQEGGKVAALGEQAIRRVRTFVVEHHAKVGRLDLEGFVEDYAETVEFSDKGRVDPDFVRRDQAAYFERYDNLSETLQGDVAVTAHDGGGWRVGYTIRSVARKKADGKEFDHRVNIVLELAPDASGGLKIVRESASVLK